MPVQVCAFTGLLLLVQVHATSTFSNIPNQHISVIVGGRELVWVKRIALDVVNFGVLDELEGGDRGALV